MALEKIHKRLTEFSINKEEAQILVFLTAMGPCPARTISRRFDYNRMKTYRTLKSMEEKGLVQRIMGRPTKFVSVPLDDILNNRIKETKQKLDDMRVYEEFILEEIGKIASSELNVTEEPRFRFYQGRQQVYEFLSQMWSNVEEELSIVTTSSDLLRLSLWGLEDKLIELSREGKRIRVLTGIEESNFEDIEKIIEDIQVRHLATEAPIRFVVMDQDEVLTSVLMDDDMSMTTQDDTVLWTNASNFAQAMKIFYESLWSLAPDANTMINSIKTGEKPQEFKTIRNKQDCEALYEEMIERSDHSIDVLVKRFSELHMSLDELFVNAKDKKLRIISNIEEDLSDLTKSNINMSNIKHNIIGSNLLLLIIDNNEVLMSTKEWENTGHCVWSNTSAYVESMSFVFEDYWENGLQSEAFYIDFVEKNEIKELANDIGSQLEKEGWVIKMPGLIKGKSSVEYSFTLSGQHSIYKDKIMGLEIVKGEDAFDRLIELNIRNMDLEAIIILSSLYPFEKNVKELANLYGIKLVEGEDANSIAKNLIEIIGVNS
jgi:sugar-specific transcriptional regulator TrmB